WGLLGAGFLASPAAYMEAYGAARAGDCCGILYGCGGSQLAAQVTWCLATTMLAMAAVVVPGVLLRAAKQLRVSQAAEVEGTDVMLHGGAEVGEHATTLLQLLTSDASFHTATDGIFSDRKMDEAAASSNFERSSTHQMTRTLSSKESDSVSMNKPDGNSVNGASRSARSGEATKRLAKALRDGKAKQSGSGRAILNVAGGMSPPVSPLASPAGSPTGRGASFKITLPQDASLLHDSSAEQSVSRGAERSVSMRDMHTGDRSTVDDPNSEAHTGPVAVHRLSSITPPSLATSATAAAVAAFTSGTSSAKGGARPSSRAGGDAATANAG
ncbi:unnamed protein product, partial [Phaeothamnion confervicola]